MPSRGCAVHRVAVAAVAGLALTLGAGAPAALGAASPVVLDRDEVDLAEKKGGGVTTEVGLTNLTDRAIQIAALSGPPRAPCRLRLDQDARLPAALHRTFEVTVPARCAPDEGGKLVFRVVAGTASLPVTAVPPKEAARPDWDNLYWFAYALLGALILMVFAFRFWPGRPAGRPRRLREPLPHLPDSWSFSDSWVSNVTVIGGLLAGVLGVSDVLDAVVGDEAEASLALATVAGAIAAGLIAAAGVFVLATTTEADGEFTAGGLLGGAALALGGAAGQLCVVYLGARELGLGGVAKYVVPGLLGAALLLLAVYAWRSVRSLLVQGTTEPEEVEEDEPAESVFAARAIAEALRAEGIEDARVHAILGRLAAGEPERAQLGAAPRPARRRAARRRSALL